MSRPDAVDVGVIGVGTMGRHHARVYEELPTTNLIGVADTNKERAREVAARYGVEGISIRELLPIVDAVSVVVPTAAHYDVTKTCLEASVPVLVEKPVAGSLQEARDFLELTRQYPQPVQVGHIERFNPAVTTVQEVIKDLDVFSIHCDRLSPPPDREIKDSSVFDLMTHDLDIVRTLLGSEPDHVVADGVDNNRHASALLSFPSGCTARLTASQKTQCKIRKLNVFAETCYIETDYTDQSVEIHRNSVPEYITGDGPVRYRHSSVVERVQVATGEPLRYQLSSFVDAVRSRRPPKVTVEDAVRTIELAEAIEQMAKHKQAGPVVA